MRSVELKLSAGRLDARYLLAPGCAKSFARTAVLVVEDAPDEVTDAEVERLVNETLINAPAHPKEPPAVAFSRLGHGRIVNLVIGRPVGSGVKPPDALRKQISLRIDDTRRAKLEEICARDKLSQSDWLERAVDRAE